MKFEKSSIFEIVGVLLIILLIFIDTENYFSKFYYFFPLIWIIASFYDIYKTKKYLKEKPKNEIRVRTKNDSYYSLIPFILGSIFCLFSIFFYFVTETEKIGVIIFFIFGVTQILQGLNFIPNSFIKIENENLNVQNGKIKHKIEVNKIRTFEINEEKIKFTTEDEKTFTIQHLELNTFEITEIECFLKNYIIKPIC